jgi:hypothetical protein
MSDQLAAGSGPVTDDLPPLLGAWDRFRREVLGEGPEIETGLSADMMTFMAGASVVVSLIRSAQTQGGATEATHAFLALEEETDAFQAVMDVVEGRRKAPH